MTIVLPPRQPKGPNFAESVLGGLAQGTGPAIQQYQSFQKEKQLQQQQQEKQARQGQALSGIIGQDISGLSTEMQMEAYKNELEKQLQAQKYEYEQGLKGQKSENEIQEKVTGYNEALQNLNRMKQLRTTGMLGLGSTYWPVAKVRQAAGEYEQLGKSLVKYASLIPITNRVEFEHYAENLSNPNITDATAKGYLDALERIINSSMAPYVQQGQQPQQVNAPGISKPSAKDFWKKKK